ncbi:hypothetical protein Slin15195_G064150 [Septoria linicola]|uniref:Uncharacterized protein n=1 Tax=Septoria linicola TaxID=215465 RepID=A0A9Q9AYQ5_9PEZI|nr:hypothetical protein Slin14017_G114470 [Septoria linicola]USW53096.1 hypothetical protein Slin15195_G064150 [Septoria linicola]
MSSPTSESHPYSYQKPSTMATRSLVSGQKPTETPSAASHDHDETRHKPDVLTRKTTSNYEQALASAQASSENDTARPGLDRLQSFSKDDHKRELMQQTLASVGSGDHGYYSTAAH